MVTAAGKVRTKPALRRLVWQQWSAAAVGSAVIVQAHRLGLAGQSSLPVLLATMAVATVCSNEELHRWLAGGDLGRRLWPRVLANMLARTPVCYLSGWGPLLGSVWIIVALLHITWSGSSAWLPSAGGAALGILLGALGIAADVFPSYLPSSQAHLIEAVQGFCVVLVLIFFGQLVGARERAEAALESEQRRFRKMLSELRCRNADGSFRWHELVVQNLLDDPDVRGVVIDQRDVSEASRAREQLSYRQPMTI